jgi:hypothetical protein
VLSASKFRRRCSPAPTRCSNDAAPRVHHAVLVVRLHNPACYVA